MNLLKKILKVWFMGVGIITSIFLAGVLGLFIIVYFLDDSEIEESTTTCSANISEEATVLYGPQEKEDSYSYSTDEETYSDDDDEDTDSPARKNEEFSQFMKEFCSKRMANKEEIIPCSPRPTPITLEYLDSITNDTVFDYMLSSLSDEERDIIYNSPKEIEINNRLKLIEAGNIIYDLDNKKVEIRPFNTFMAEEVLYEDGCQSFITDLFYDAIYFDPVEETYYHGDAQITNNIVYELNINTNNIDLRSTNAIIHLTNLSATSRLYLDLDSNVLFIRNLSFIYDKVRLGSNTKVIHTYYNKTRIFPRYLYINTLENTTNSNLYGRHIGAGFLLKNTAIAEDLFLNQATCFHKGTQLGF